MDKKLIEYIVGGKRFTIIKGYRFDKLIFGFFVLLMLASFVLVFALNGSDKTEHIYFKCSSVGGCENVFYMNYPICEKVWAGACNEEFVNNGFVYGEPMPWIVSQWLNLILLSLVLVFILNHFIHNRKYIKGIDKTYK